MGDEMSTPRPGTTASIERRVEKLEQQMDAFQVGQNALSTQIELVKVEQGHMKELMGAKFSTLETAMGSMVAKFEQVIAGIQSAMSDANATPAGRQGMDALKRVHERIDELEKDKDIDHEDMADRLEEVEKLAKSNREWIVRAGGIVAVLLTLLTLFSPQIRQLLFGGTFTP